MRVLIILTSPLGDIIHTLPAIHDAQRHMPNLMVDWVVEEAFAEVPKWHAGVDGLITTAMRRWRKHLFQTLASPEWRQFKSDIGKQHYDLVIDCQGLIKSACVGKLANAPVAGLEKKHLREPLAAWLYQHKIPVDGRLPMVERMRSFFAQALGYPLPSTRADFGIDRQQFCGGYRESDNVVFLHSSSRSKKLYPESYWRLFAQQLTAQGLRVRLPWGKASERERAERIAQGIYNVEVLPKLNLHGVACVLAQANAVVALDTGLGHLSAALGVPTLSLYNSSHAATMGAHGSNQRHIYVQQPGDEKQQTLAALNPSEVLKQLLPMLEKGSATEICKNNTFRAVS